MSTQRIIVGIAIVLAIGGWYRFRLRHSDPVSPAGYTKASGVSYWSATKRRPVY